MGDGIALVSYFPQQIEGYQAFASPEGDSIGSKKKIIDPTIFGLPRPGCQGIESREP